MFQLLNTAAAAASGVEEENDALFAALNVNDAPEPSTLRTPGVLKEVQQLSLTEYIKNAVQQIDATLNGVDLAAMLDAEKEAANGTQK